MARHKRQERQKRKRRGSNGYPAGTDRERPGTDGEQPGTDGYPSGQPGTDGYLSGTDGYQTQEHADRGRYDEEEDFDLAARFMEPEEGWWTRYGYRSLGEYLRDKAEGPVRTWTPPRPKRSIPTPQPPNPDPPPVPARRSGRWRQVAARLDEEGYEALTKAARIYGVAPSTMARLLIHRGAMAALEQERR
jgi:hypothetical protein